MLALAVTTKARFAGLPGVAAMVEFLPGYEATGWLGVGAPSATAVAIVDKLNAETNAVLADPLIRTRLLDMGIEPMSMTAGAFSKFIAAETTKWQGWSSSRASSGSDRRLPAVRSLSLPK
jgi:tripartite-type tricarboxylate transporter receptor subunit TctC